MIDEFLALSLREGKRITIIYQSASSGITARDITVLAIDGGRIRAVCHLRQAKRTFDRGRILSAGYAKDADSAP